MRRLDSMYLPVECQANFSHKMGSHPLNFTMLSRPLVKCGVAAPDEMVEPPTLAGRKLMG